jgi:hypothetical protein
MEHSCGRHSEGINVESLLVERHSSEGKDNLEDD